jgi:N-acetylglucosamine kinase-like BadF-type ATPase
MNDDRFRIGVDGGGTKTELILVDNRGEIAARHRAPGCNPNLYGQTHAREILEKALRALLATAAKEIHVGSIARTLLCMAGAPQFWRETAAAFTTAGEFGQVTACDDSAAVLELATLGRPGLVLHGGTGSFVAARDVSGKVHYAGGLGWRFGDEGGGHALGRLAIARALSELQGWAPRSALAALVLKHTGAPEVQAATRWFYQHAEPHRTIAALAPAVLDLAAHGEEAAAQVVREACLPLLALAARVAEKLFPTRELAQLPAGLSGPILTHPFVQTLLRGHTGLPLRPIIEPPIEGVRRLLSSS